jgi:hypothetical protein
MNITAPTGLNPRIVKNPRTGPAEFTMNGNLDLAIGSVGVAAGVRYRSKPERSITVGNAIWSRDSVFGGVQTHRHPEILSLTIGELRQYMGGGKMPPALKNYLPRPAQRRMIGKL